MHVVFQREELQPTVTIVAPGTTEDQKVSMHLESRVRLAEHTLLDKALALYILEIGLEFASWAWLHGIAMQFMYSVLSIFEQD